MPHRRIETRGGEVSKGVTERSRQLTALAAEFARHLPDAWGPLCYQAFVDGDVIRIIEINARFGGGYPLTHHAGAHFVRWLIDDCLGRELPEPDSVRWQEGVAMTRWDDAVFCNAREMAG